MQIKSEIVILISADAEWRVVRKIFENPLIQRSPYGKWFKFSYSNVPDINETVIFFHGGWGKVAAAGSTQYVISKWRPKLIINLGTCGGIEGDIERGEIILVENTVIYDIYEQMGDPREHIRHYTTEIDYAWVKGPLPLKVIRTLLISGDRDLMCAEIPSLKASYGAVASDWESGAIAWVANRNQTQCLILRGVTDLVNEKGGEAYDGKVENYYRNTELIMDKLIESIPGWISVYKKYSSI